MVDSVSNTTVNSLLRAQQAGSAQALNATRSPTTITQTRAAAVAPVKSANAVKQPLIVASANSNLPRGSIVDKLI